MMIDVKEVARLLKVSEKNIYRWIARKEIPAYKIGQIYRFNRVELLEWATSKKIAVSPEIFDEVLDTENTTTSLVDAIRAGGIHYNVAGTDSGSVIRAIVSIINLPGDIDRELLAGALIARENLGTTAIGDGVAIPHVRNPIIFHVDKPVLALCFLQQSVDFGALDNKPVDTVFTIITPNVRSHLNTLSRLSFALHRPEIRQIISAESGSDDIFTTISAFEATLNNGRDANNG